MQTFNQLFFKKKQIFSYFFKEISDYCRAIDLLAVGWPCNIYTDLLTFFASGILKLNDCSDVNITKQIKTETK